MEIVLGHIDRLGATPQADGTNFALFSANAEAVDLCLFHEHTGEQISCLPLPGRDGDVWHGFVPGAAPGCRYGYRVQGPYNPHKGQRFNRNKLLLDPYTRQLAGEFVWDSANFAYARDGSGDQDLSFCSRDNSRFVPKAVVTATPQTLAPAAHPRVPWSKSIIYEAHVRGLTRLHPQVPSPERGAFAGMGRRCIVDYLKALGITAVQLLPVQAFIDERALYERGLSNYWGYNTLGFFTPHPAYLSGGDIMEFRRLVDTYHEAGIEVLLDVVYNHSCESDQLGPTLSMRGIDNQSYYRLNPEQPRFYVNDTGCGNTLNMDQPKVRRLVIDSLLYWSTVMGVDGFRFDLATVLGRTGSGFSPSSDFFRELQAEPGLAHCKFIAEPWDIGPGGYQLGAFPAPWAEWNDRYRDSQRRFWRGDPGELAELAGRIQGSADLFEGSGRPPSASVNYVCSHDGFTLRDLVTYTQRQNEANGEGNRDGHGANLSCNLGHEGETENVSINRARRQRQRNFLALLALSQGVPMLQAGDELGRTTGGNNNAYCQDNPINWVDWEAGLKNESELLEFTQRIFQLRSRSSLLHANAYTHTDCDSAAGCLLWFAEDGEPMREDHWHDHERRALAFLLRRECARKGCEELLVLLNAGGEARRFTLPRSRAGTTGGWRLMLDTARPDPRPMAHAAPKVQSLDAHSLQLFFPHKAS